MTDNQISSSPSQSHPCLLGRIPYHEIVVWVLLSASECGRCVAGKAVPWPLCSVLNHSEIDDAVSRYLKLMFLSVLSFWAISLIINGSTWTALAMMLNFNQTFLVVLQRALER